MSRPGRTRRHVPTLRGDAAFDRSRVRRRKGSAVVLAADRLEGNPPGTTGGGAGAPLFRPAGARLAPHTRRVISVRAVGRGRRGRQHRGTAGLASLTGGRPEPAAAGRHGGAIYA
jgi:hypothetical protein